MREERLRDLGGLALEMYKRDRFNAGLVVERCAELVAIEARVQEIDALLDGSALVRRGGGGAVCICGAPILLGAQFCATCGRRSAAAASRRGPPDRTRSDDELSALRRAARVGPGVLPRLRRSRRRAPRRESEASLSHGLDAPRARDRRRRAARRRRRGRRDGLRRRRARRSSPRSAASPRRRTAPPARRRSGPSGVAEWPTDEDGWTIALASVPQTAGRATALGRARAARRKGLPQVGVLDSSRYASLHPGYWIVFSGVYSSEAEATSALEDARRVSRTAVVRHVVP